MIRMVSTWSCPPTQCTPRMPFVPLEEADGYRKTTVNADIASRTGAYSVVCYERYATSLDSIITSLGGRSDAFRLRVSEGDFFPYTGYETNIVPDGEVHGRLVLVNGYVRVRSLFPTFGFLFGTSDLIIWPHGYSAEIRGDGIVVLDIYGRVAARVGDVIKARGGRIPSLAGAEKAIGRTLPQECRGPYSTAWPEVISDR